MCVGERRARDGPSARPAIRPRTSHRLAGRLSDLARYDWMRDGTPGLTVCAPATGEWLADVPIAGPIELDRVLEAARAAQREWQTVSPSGRARVVNRFRKLLIERAEDLLDILQAETGKARVDAFEEVADVALVTGYYVRVGPSLLKPRRRRGAVPGLTRTVEVRHPYGVVGVIAPWNYPLVLAVSDAVPAVLAGNSVIVKPDPQTTHTALAATELFLEAGLPPGVFQVVPGDGPTTGKELVDRVDFVSFTGSTETGRVVARQAAERLTGCSLELGGKNPMVVRADADVDAAAAGAIRGCFANAGQLCVAIERIYVHRSIHDAFLARFIEMVGDIRLGSGPDYAYDMGSLTCESQLRKVEEHVTDAVDRGAEVRAGGRPRPDIGPLFYEPTVLTGLTPDMKAYSEETFGPVVAVAPFDSDEEAIRLANESCYGLNASVWTRDPGRAQWMARRLDTGSVNVNEAYSASWASVDAPYGGRRCSGSGRRHGAPGLLNYTQSQVIAAERGGALHVPARWLRRPAVRAAMLGVLKRLKPGAARR